MKKMYPVHPPLDSFDSSYLHSKFCEIRITLGANRRGSPHPDSHGFTPQALHFATVRQYCVAAPLNMD